MGSLARLRFSLLLLGALAVFPACNRSRAPGPVHEAPVATAANPQESAEKRDGPEVTAEQLQTPAGLKAQVSSALDPEVLGNERFSRAETGRKNLTLLNEALLLLLEGAKGKPLTTDLAKAAADYKRSLLAGCSIELKSCSQLEYFQTDSRSARIALELAERESSLDEAYRLMRVAYSLQGRRELKELDAAYLKRALPYYRQISKDGARRGSAKEHLELMTQILSRATSHELPIDSKTIDDLKPWDFVTGAEPELMQVKELALRITLKKGIYSKDKGLDPAFKSRIDELAKLDGSLSQKIAQIEKEMPGVLKVLALEGGVPTDENFYIFENLYLERIDSARASHLWDSTRRSTDMARKSLLEYTRLRLAISLFAANREFQKFFKAKGQFNSSSVLAEGLKKGRDVADLWRDDLRRLSRLADFGERHLDDKTRGAQEMKFFFAGIDRNVKFLSTYPSMMIVIYHLARLNFSMEQTFVDRAVKLDAGQIMRLYFNGTLSPFLYFSDDNEPLRQAEVMQAYAFALRTGALASAGISNKEFFRLVIKQMLGNDRVKVGQLIAALDAKFSHDPNYSGFLSDCESLKTTGKLRSQSPLETLQYYVALGFPHTSGYPEAMSPKLMRAWDFFDTDTNITKWQMDEYLEIVRLDYSPRIDQITVLIDLLEQTLKETSPATAEAEIKEVRAMLGPDIELRRSFYKRIFSNYRTIGPCMDKAVEQEDNGQRFIVRMMTAHLREVHAEMQKLRASGAGPAPSATFNLGSDPRMPVAGLKSYETVNSLGVAPDFYRFSRLQVLLRMKLALEHGAKTASGDEPAMRIPGSLVLPEGGVRGVKDDLKNSFMELSYNDDVESFVAMGLSKMFARVEPLTHWWDLSDVFGALTRRFNFLAALYKTGEVETAAGAKERLSAKDFIESSLRSATVAELGPEWQDVLRKIGRDDRFRHYQNLIGLAYGKSDNKPMGLADYAFLRSRKELLGAHVDRNEMEEDENQGGETRRAAAGDERRPGILRAAKDYFKSKRALGGTAFRLPPEAIDRLERFYADRADLDLAMQAELIATARAIEAKPQAAEALPRWRYSLRNLGASPVPILSETSLESFRYGVSHFYNFTRRPIPPALVIPD